jgi:hypothetical protein
LREQHGNDGRTRGLSQRGAVDLARARRLAAGLLVLAAVSSGPLRAQTDAARAESPSERFLLIVETSKAMQRRAEAMLEVVQDMLMSGLNGRMRDGSSLGAWTFNEDLSPGRLPLQTWSSSTREIITQHTLTFLKGQKYEKQASFDKVGPALSRVIGDSRRLTVILISSGDWKMRGTPFDDRINASFQQWREQQQKARMPFVTVLCARKGQVEAYAVNTPPWPLQVPELAEAPVSVPPPSRPAVEVRRSAPTSTVAPLILIGKKASPEPVPTPKPEPVATVTQAPPPVVAAVVTNQPAVAKPPEPAPAAVEVAQVQPAPPVPEKPLTESPPQAPVAPIPASEPKPETARAPEPKPAEPAPAKPVAVQPPTVPMSKPEPAVVEQPKPVAAPEVKAQAAPAPALPPEVAPPANPNAAIAQAATSGPSSHTASPSVPATPAAETATAAPAESLLHTRTIVMAAVVLAVLVAGLAFLLMRRTRATPQGSLITRSFEREKGE